MDRRPWTATDRVGPIDELFAVVRTSCPGVSIERLIGTFPGDDYYLWWITDVASGVDLQVESNVDGKAPFLLESNDARYETDDLADLTRKLLEWLPKDQSAAQED